MHAAQRWILALVALSLAACGQSHGGDRPLAATSEWLPAALCARWERCSTSTPWGTEGCEAWMRERWLENTAHAMYEQAIADGTLRPRDDGRARCEARLAGACDWEVLAARYGPSGIGGLAGLGGLGGPLSCADVVEGLVAVGDACVRDEECAGTATCREAVCRAPLGEGETGCSETFGTARSDCAEGLTCASDAMSSRSCARMPAVGDACADLMPSCEIGGRCESGICVAVDRVSRSLGDVCGPATAPCEHGLICAVDACVVAPRAGEPCIGSPDLPPSNRACDDGLRCAEDGLCVALPIEGEACAPLGALGGWCSGLLNCVDARCVPGSSNGESCTVREECFSRHCEDGECVAPPFAPLG